MPHLIARITILTTILATVTGPIAAGSLDGHWQGAVSRLGAVQTVQLDISTTADSLSAKYSIPDLGLYDEPVEIRRHADSITVRIFYGRFTMLHHDELDELTGINTNWNPPVSLHLKRTTAVRGHATQFLAIPTDIGMLHGRLYLPRGNGPHPGVVVVAGSGEQGLHDWMYRSWGNVLASHGFATLVYDKRGVGPSDGDLAGATFDDLAADVVAAFRALRTHPDIDSARLGMMGISQGGWLVPMAIPTAAPAFTILLVAPAVDVWTQETHRIEYAMRADGYDDTAVAKALQLADDLFDVADNKQSFESYEALARQYDTAAWYPDYFGPYVHADSILDWRSQRYDPEDDLRAIAYPTLVIYGRDDLFVPPAHNRDLMQRYLSAAPTARFDIMVIDGVGHDLMTGHSLVGTTWDWPSQFWRWNRRPVQLYDAIVAFLAPFASGD